MSENMLCWMNLWDSEHNTQPQLQAVEQREVQSSVGTVSSHHFINTERWMCPH